MSFGPPDSEIEVSGTCQAIDPMECEGGAAEMGDPAGTCTGEGEVCCIDTDQCVETLGGTCVASDDECDLEGPPMGFPELGCTSAAPVCCVDLMGGGGK